MTDLKPCPFCGGEAEMKYEVSPAFGDIYYVQCECLRAQTQLYQTESEAIAAWNARAERTCELELDGTFKYKHGGSGHEQKELFGTEWRVMERRRCSSCHKVLLVDDSIAYEYCPHCGAKVVDA